MLVANLGQWTCKPCARVVALKGKISCVLKGMLLIAAERCRCTAVFMGTFARVFVGDGLHIHDALY